LIEESDCPWVRKLARDVLIARQKVRRIVLLLEGDEPGVVRSIGLADPLLAVLDRILEPPGAPIDLSLIGPPAPS
jgi:hypothetical protein